VPAPKIYFASRTHGQLAHAIKELKKSPYTARISIMASRDQLCVNEDLAELRGGELNSACNKKRTNCDCEYYSNFVLDAEENPQKLLHDMQADTVQDIEDMFKTGKEKKCCPFYFERHLQESAEMIFLPYNYVISPSIREYSKLDLKNAIVVFDEAHNLPQVAEDSITTELRMVIVAQCILELSEVLSLMRSNADETNSAAAQDLKNVEELRQSLLELDMTVDALQIPQSNRSLTKPGKWMFDLLCEAGITRNTFSYTSNIMLKCSQFLRGQGKRTFALESFHRALKMLFGSKESNEIVEESFRVNLSETANSTVFNKPEYAGYLELREEAFKPKDKSTTRNVQMWCLNPALAIQNLLSVEGRPPQCLILTSGTLSPMKSYAQELGASFPPGLRVENPHVIKKDQLSVFVCSSGKRGRPLTSEFSHRSSKIYHEEVGESLIDLSKLVPGGLLVFFASYSVMGYCITTWKESSIFVQIEANKEIFMEPSSTKDLPNLIEKFQTSVRENPKGAIMFAVCRGKVAEGLDFANDNGRCVVIVGLPFPPKEDPRVLMKQEVLDRLCEKDRQHHTLNGKNWYAQLCAQAINQSVGRVIRHRNDYGAVILMDERFANIQQQTQLSYWLHKHLKTPNTFDNLKEDLKSFYETARNLPLKEIPKPAEKMEKKISIADARVVPTKGTHFTPKVSNQDRPIVIESTRKLPENVHADKARAQLSGKQFVNEVKLNLSGRDFKRFKSLIRFFSGNHSHEEKLETVRELNQLFESHSQLIDGLKPFVREYGQYLNTKKRKSQDILTGISKKKRKVQSQPESKDGMSVSQRSQGGTHPSQGNELGRNIQEKGTSKPHFSGSASTDWAQALQNAFNPSEAGRSVTETLTPPAAVNNATSATTSHHVPIEISPEKSPQPHTEASLSLSMKCPVCFESEGKIFNAAPCGHICCNACWESLLKFKVECPVCKTKVRQKQLITLFPQ